MTAHVVALVDAGGDERDLVAGFEEEGVPLRVEREPGEAAELAQLAAARSPLGVGIGADSELLELALAALPGRSYLVGTPSEARAFGHAAARLTARRPL